MAIAVACLTLCVLVKFLKKAWSAVSLVLSQMSTRAVIGVLLNVTGSSDRIIVTGERDGDEYRRGEPIGDLDNLLPRRFIVTAALSGLGE